MERLLQVADECDDAIAACRHWFLGSATRIATAMAVGAVMAGIAAATWLVPAG